MRSDFEEFAEGELPGLLRYATMLTGDPDLARDLVQDVMVKAHRHWDHHAQTVVDRAALWDQMADLPRQQRAVLVLRYYERLTDIEIAEVLDCTAGTVRGYASRALAALRLHHADHLEPSEETS